MNTDLASLSKKQLLALADQLEAAKRTSELASVLEQICVLLPKSPIYRERLGRVYLKLKMYKKSEQSFKRVFEIQKKPRLELQVLLAQCLAETMRYAEALEILELLRRKGVSDKASYNLHGQVLYGSGDSDGAIRLLEEAREKFPADAQLLHSLSEAYFISERFSDAVWAAEKSIAQGNTSIFIHRLLGRSAAESGNLDLAYRTFESALEKNFLDTETHQVCMKALVVAIGLDGAIGWLQKYKQTVLEEPVRDFHLASLLLRAGRAQESAEALDRVLKRQQNSTMLLDVMARLSAMKGDWRQAVAQASILWDFCAKKIDSEQKIEITKRAAAPLSSVHKLIYMPVEIAQREFESRLMVAFRAASGGAAVVIGGRHLVDDASANLPAGLFFLKTLNHYDKLVAVNLHSTMHRIVALDEEELGAFGKPKDVVVGIDPDIADSIDMMMANNDAHMAAIQAIYPNLAERTVVTGNPRLELLDQKFCDAFDSEAAKIKADYDQVVLICTNFGGFASTTWDYSSTCYITLKALNRAPSTPRGKEIVQMGKDYALSEALSMAALSEFVPEIAKEFPDIKFVVRPHPSENKEIWKNKFSGIDNIEVAPVGSLQGWIRASRAVIYFAGCMTGVEATLAGVPAIRFEAGKDLDFPKLGVSAHINLPASNGAEISILLHQVLNGRFNEYDNSKDRELLKREMLVEEPAPSIRCANALTRYLESLAAVPITADTIADMKTALKGGLSLQKARVVRGDSVGELKKITTNLPDVLDKLTHWQTVLGEFEDVAVEQLAEGVFLVNRIGDMASA